MQGPPVTLDEAGIAALADEAFGLDVGAGLRGAVAVGGIGGVLGFRVGAEVAGQQRGVVDARHRIDDAGVVGRVAVFVALFVICVAPTQGLRSRPSGHRPQRLEIEQKFRASRDLQSCDLPSAFRGDGSRSRFARN